EKPWSNLLKSKQFESTPPIRSVPTPVLIASPSPSPSATARPSSTSTDRPITSISTFTPPTYFFNGEVSFSGGAPHRLDNVLKTAGYKGPMTLETLEFYNPSDVSVCWRIG